MKELIKHLKFLEKELAEEILDTCSTKTLPPDTFILKEGEYVAALPLVTKGIIKVYSSFEEKELLLYYIKPNESCVMSFSSLINEEPSRIFAVTEEETEIIILPREKIKEWINKYRSLTSLFFRLYDLRYIELLDMLRTALFENLDKRLIDYLKEKRAISGNDIVKITHREIANDLGTAREVVSRIIKKLEHDGKVQQLSNSIKLTLGDNSH